MNPDLGRLQAYPFEKLASLKQGISPPPHLDAIGLQIGEPKHPTPRLIGDALRAHLHRLSSYPTTRGTAELREGIASWIKRRSQTSGLSIDPERQLLPVNGSREALFAFAQAAVDRSRDPLVLMPNPCYQIYEGAALLAGAEPGYLACEASNGFIPDFEAIDPATWDRCQLLYICSPGNPSGAVFDRTILTRLIELAHRHDFVIASDECYSEIYRDESSPPPGLLETAATMGNDGFSRCIVFNSLSKRSNAPGLRSGFVAGDAALIQGFLAYRTYHGCAMSLPVQSASAAAWSDEGHVAENRRLYREKIAVFTDILGDVMPLDPPEASFFLWPETPIPDTEFAQRLFAEENVTLLPGRFLSRNIDGQDPGANRVRIALVPDIEVCVDAARRIRAFIERL